MRQNQKVRRKQLPNVFEEILEREVGLFNLSLCKYKTVGVQNLIFLQPENSSIVRYSIKDGQ